MSECPCPPGQVIQTALNDKCPNVRVRLVLPNVVTLVTHGHIGHTWSHWSHMVTSVTWSHMVTLVTHVHISHTWSHRVKVQPNLNYETNVYQKVSSLTVEKIK